MTRTRLPALWRLFIGAALLIGVPALSGAAASASGELVRQGERLYRDGVREDGSPLPASILGDKVNSPLFACATCHARGGLGIPEGKFQVPPVNGPNLFGPRYLPKDQLKNALARSRGGKSDARPQRPAYSDETLARALREGVDPSGRPLLPAMPRYDLSQAQLSALTAYLKGLSSASAPGVSATALHFATIVTEEVSEADREAMLAPLRTLVAINRQSRNQKKFPQFAKMSRLLENAYFRDITLSVWELKGRPESWRAQLEAHYLAEPVFALLGGISEGSWQPMHDFCEEHRIPCLFPITDLPVVDSDGWYTLYASKGYYQEGETAARFLAGPDRGAQRILQLVAPGAEAEALAAGFTGNWKGRGELHTVRLEPGRAPTQTELHALVQQYRPTHLILWGGGDLLDLAGREPVPELVLSGRYLGAGIGGVPEALRARTYLTYPYRLPEAERAYQGYDELLLLAKPRQKDGKRIGSRVFSLVHLLLQGLRELRLDFYRDTLLDVIDTRPDQHLPDFERMSFGPGQRYASKGCYMVQLGPGANPGLIRKSEWVVF